MGILLLCLKAVKLYVGASYAILYGIPCRPEKAVPDITPKCTTFVLPIVF